MLPSYEVMCNADAIPDMDECLARPSTSNINHLLVAPSHEKEPNHVDLYELPMKGDFVSVSGREEKTSIQHAKAIERQRELIGELTPDILLSYLPPPQEAPLHEYAIESPPKSFIGLIKSILSQPEVRKDHPPFRFSTDENSIQHNATTLESYNFDLEKIIKDVDSNNIISPGSEFRDSHLLGPLLHSHPHWESFKDMIDNGVSCDFAPLSEEQRLKDLDSALQRGNHKSASSQQDLLESLIQNDVEHGHQLPVPKDIIKKIKGIVVQPYGIENQFSVNELGERIEKDRLIHDQSFDFSENNSVNHRLILSNFFQLRYGHCLSQIIHCAHALRLREPRKRIVANKIDLKSACRRAHVSGSIAAMATTIVGALALISLRLPFGGTCCVCCWCVISEFICDVANALLRCTCWCPDSINFPLKNMIPDPSLLPDEDEHSQALIPDVLVDPDSRGKAFCYIDDLITVGYYDKNWKRLNYAVATVMNVFGRPVSSSEPIPREHLTSAKKLKAEGNLEEVKIILGWQLNFRTMIASLPEDKHKAWSNDVHSFIDNRSSSMKELKSLIGRLSHSCTILRMGYHFLHRLRSKVNLSVNGNAIARCSPKEIKQLKLWLNLLSRARQGVSFNLIIFRRPTKIYISDACPYGMGGFSVNSGRAWRMSIPPDLIGKVSNNLLEYIAEIVCVWIDILNGDVVEFDCCLSLGDNTSAISWLHLTRFCDEGDGAHEEASNKIANL